MIEGRWLWVASAMLAAICAACDPSQACLKGTELEPCVRACNEGTADYGGCLSAAHRALGDGLESASDEQRIKAIAFDRQGCKLGATQACLDGLRIADAMRTPNGAEGFDDGPAVRAELEEGSCMTGQTSSCSKVGDRLLAVDRERARRAYERMCDPSDKPCEGSRKEALARVDQANALTGECDGAKPGACAELGRLLYPFDEVQGVLRLTKECEARGLSGLRSADDAQCEAARKDAREFGFLTGCAGKGPLDEPFSEVRGCEGWLLRATHRAQVAALGGAPVPCGPNFGSLRESSKKPQPPTVRLEPPSLGEGAPGSAPSVLAASEPALRACYEGTLCLNPNLQGTVKLQFYIDREGEPALVSAADSTAPDRSLTDCMVRVVEQLRFPKLTGRAPLVALRVVVAPPY